MDERTRPASVGLVAGVIAALLFVGGFAAGALFQRGYSSSADDPGVREFLTAYQLVTQHSYYRPLNKQHLIYAAIDGMLAATGDPHTLFLSPNENSSANEALNGSEFSGIGAIVMPQGTALEIITPLPHTPSAEAGIHPGDRVVAIDGVPVSRMSGDQAVARIHGKAGSSVRLTIRRGKAAPFVVRVRREQIPPITAYGRMLAHHLGYIQIFSFGDTTGREVADAVSLLQSEHARALILDLRDNPGGYVDAAQQVVSEFVSRGIVAYEQSPNKQLTPLRVVRQSVLTQLPVAILVNSGTASAAEITAGALRDDRHAEIIGTRTYGKGSMQSVYPLADGSSIRITDRLWLTPDKHSIQGVGLKPNIPISPSATGDAALQAAERYLVQHRAP